MRKRQTFLLTIISSETGDASLCGRIKVISSGKTRNFTCVDDLHNIIQQEMDEETLQQFEALNLDGKYSNKNLSSSSS